MYRPGTDSKHYSLLGNALKGFGVGLLCNIYFFGNHNLEKLLEAIAFFMKSQPSEASYEAFHDLMAEAGTLSSMSKQMMESGYLLAGLLVLVSCTLVGYWDGIRERRIRDLQNESEARLQRLQEAQDRLTNVQRRLAHSERLAAIGRMAAGVSHEINNPLAAVSGHIRLLDMQLAEDDPRHPLLEVMQKETRRIRDIVRGMNDFARSQPDPEEIRKSTADVHEIIEEALVAFDPRFKEAGIDVERQLNTSSLFVFGKTDHLRLALNNLISNAIEAMDGSGKLTIRTSSATVDRDGIMHLRGYQPTQASEDGSRDTKRTVGPGTEFSMPLLLEEGDPVVLLEILDTGVGISEEILNKIFEPFVTTKGVGYGLGLGLAITYSIIRSHSGYIEVQSKDGEDTKFTVVLPSAGEKRESESEQPEPVALTESTA